MSFRRRFDLAPAVALASIIAALGGGASANDLPTGPGTPAQLLAAADAANPGWREAAERALPAGWTLGRLYRVEDAAGKAFFAAFPQGGDRPWAPGNAFDAGKTIEVGLETRDHRQAVATRVYARPADDHAGSEDEQALLMAQLQASARADGAHGIMPCQIRGWALNEGSSGTAVRKNPADTAPIAGWLAPLFVSLDTDESAINGFRVEFDITGYKDGWFRIANASAPGARYGAEVPRSHPRTYAGTGWVHVTDVTGAYGETQMPVRQLLEYPHVDARALSPGINSSDDSGNLSIDGTLVRLHACSANWALTTSRDGQRGWWRGVCSNQVTNCS